MAANDETDTADSMNELEDLPKNSKMLPARNIQQEKRSAIQEQKKMKNYTNNRAPNHKADNGA